MAKRLVWNFEIDPKEPLLLPPAAPKEELRWEKRFFWPENTIITLKGLDESFLQLSVYKIKSRSDTYLLRPEDNYNIKLRHKEWLYKPLLKQQEDLFGFGKKIDLKEAIPFPLDSLHIQQLLEVRKEVLIHSFATEPVIKLELAKLIIRNTVYYSVCVEGRSLQLVQLISNHLLPDQISCDYVSFLKKIL